jgi:UDP-N-acetylglucosamine 2-epimerase (non-hydrolysing)
VEAGLRTYDKYSPFPEEINRQIISRLADVHFAPTESAKKNLLDENVPSEKIYVVGNTEIDSLLWILDHQKQEGGQQEMGKVLVSKYGLQLDDNKKIILVTAHRRESFGQGLKNICEALREISIKRNDVIIIYTVHPNPNVRKTADSILRNSRNIQLVSPFDYSSFAFLMNKSHFILTDSGGIQEAAPFLNKPVLVMREKTERQEGVEIGASKIVGIDKDLIVESALELLDNKEIYNSMINKRNPYGDGHAAERIVGFIKKLI